MEALEVFAIIILVGAILLVLYFYLKNSTYSSSLDRVKTQVYGIGSEIGEKVSGGEGETSTVSETMSGVSEKVYGVGEKIRGKVKEVPISTDILSGKIESFLDEKSDQLIKDWELATKPELSDLESRLEKVSRDMEGLERRFNEYKGYTNNKLESIEKRLKKLEGEEETTEK